MRFHFLLSCLLLTACSRSSSPSAATPTPVIPVADAASDGSPGYPPSLPGITTDGGLDGGTPPDTGLLDGGMPPDSALDARSSMDAAMDASLDRDGSLPEAADACSTDLTFVGGHVQPDYGSVGSLDAGGVDPEEAGPYAVFEQVVKVPVSAETRHAAGYDIEITAGELDGTIYAPSEDKGTSAAKGRFPLVIGLPGFGAAYDNYASYFRHFASYGFVVLGMNTRASTTVAQHDKEALETSQAISWMIGASSVKDHVDADKVVTTGHSKGGKVSFFAAAIDARVDMVFGWDPSNAGGPPCGIVDDKSCNAEPVAPNCLAQKAGVAQPWGVLQYLQAESFVFGVPPDPSFNPTPEHNSINFYRGAPSPASLVYFNGGHAAWVSDGLAGVVGDANIIRVTQAVQTAKMLTVLRGATGLEAYLPGGDYLTKQGTLVTQVATK